MVISLTGLLFDLTKTSMKNLLLQIDRFTITALNPSSTSQALNFLPHTGLLGISLTLTVHLLLNFPVFLITGMANL